MRILSIDPGTNNTGVAIIDFDGKDFHVPFCETIKADKISKLYGFVFTIHGSRYARVLASADRIAKILKLYKPDFVVCESPYMGRFAQSFAALTELIAEIRNRVFNHDVGILVHFIDPSSVKKHHGVRGTSGNKSEMTDALNKKTLLYSEHLNPATFDEHTIDALLIGLCFADRLLTIK